MPWGTPSRAGWLDQNRRLTSDFARSLIGDAALQGFWRVESGHVTSGGGAISQLDDQSGNGRHATQTSGALKPTLDTTTYGTWCASFFAGGILELADTLAAAMPQNNWTLATVRKLATTSGSQTTIAVGALGGYAETMESAKPSIRHQGQAVAADGAATTTKRLVVCQRISGVDHMSINGVEVALTGTPGQGTPSGVSAIGMLLLAGLFFPLDGDLFEVIALSRLLTGGAPGVGNSNTGELAALYASSAARYAL
jgi:hypothetical protein